MEEHTYAITPNILLSMSTSTHGSNLLVINARNLLSVSNVLPFIYMGKCLLVFTFIIRNAKIFHKSQRKLLAGIH